MLEYVMSILKYASPYIVQIMACIIFGLVLWVLKRFVTKLGIEADEKVRKYLIETLQVSIVYGKNKVDEELGSTDLTKVEVRNAIVAHASNYVINKVPDAVKKFNLKEEDIKDLVLARLEEK